MLGRCIEVWAAHDAEIPSVSAMRRFSQVRTWWLETSGVASGREARELIPFAAPWSVEYLMYRGQAKQIGRSVESFVAERLAAAGVHIFELDDLRDEANRLLDLGTGVTARTQTRSRT
jgi:hypothetical protein